MKIVCCPVATALKYCKYYTRHIHRITIIHEKKNILDFNTYFMNVNKKPDTVDRVHCSKRARARLCVCVSLEIIDSCDRSIYRHFCEYFTIITHISLCCTRVFPCKNGFSRIFYNNMPQIGKTIYMSTTYNVHKSTNIFQIIKLIIVIDGYGVFIRQLHSGSS